jgi:uncharacterized protein YwgA
MTPNEIMLAALALGQREEFSPVQLQKMMFLIDRNIGPVLGGPFFDFKPYDYGPFDSGVYDTFSALTHSDLGEMSGEGRDRRYRLSDQGRARADEVLAQLDASCKKYIQDVAGFVQTLSFSQLVSSIYKHYPEMKVNSVFRG